MLSGNAVVALNNGHAADVVKHMETGLLVDPECLSDIPDTVTRILTDDILRDDSGALLQPMRMKPY